MSESDRVREVYEALVLGTHDYVTKTGFASVLIGLSGLAAHFCLTTALSLAPAAVVTPIDFARLPLIAVIGALFYAEPIDSSVIIGGALILAANWLNLTRGQTAARRDILP